MRMSAPFGRIVVFACAAAIWSCGDSRSPVSPSSLTPLTVPGESLRFDSLDDHEPAPDPGPAPMPDPEPTPAPDPGPVAAAVTISIVGSFGNNAFNPNPIQAAVGDMIVWKNSDREVHRIVLDDGTVVGEVAPGESSTPMPLTTPTVNYRCTIHPTMVGSINGEVVVDPPPSPGPPPPSPDPPPPDDYYGY